MTAPELWHLLIHTPGPNADPAVPMSEAPWFPQHRKLHIRLAEAGYLIAAGPLPGRSYFPGDPRGWEKAHLQTAKLTELGEKLLGMRAWG